MLLAFVLVIHYNYKVQPGPGGAAGALEGLPSPGPSRDRSGVGARGGTGLWPCSARGDTPGKPAQIPPGSGSWQRFGALGAGGLAWPPRSSSPLPPAEPPRLAPLGSDITISLFIHLFIHL